MASARGGETNPIDMEQNKGVVHGVFGQGKDLMDLIQHGMSAGMPLYVRCPICQKDFKQKSTLLQHGCVHIESRPYPCRECGKRFRQQSHLVQHIRIHTNEKPYICVYCGRAFRQRAILNQHLRIHTGEKRYKCPQCGKDFRQKTTLDQHVRTHQADHLFGCPLPNCKQKFTTEEDVNRHLQTHDLMRQAEGRPEDPGQRVPPVSGEPRPPLPPGLRPDRVRLACLPPPPEALQVPRPPVSPSAAHRTTPITSVLHSLFYTDLTRFRKQEWNVQK